MNSPRLSGANVVEARKALVKLLGADVVTRAIAALPDGDREIYGLATAVGWVPLSITENVLVNCAERAHWPLDLLASETARVATETLVTGLWRVLLRFTSDSALVSRTPLLYSKTYDTGSLSSDLPGGGRATITLTGWPDIPELQILSLGSGIATVLRCAGREQVRLTPQRTSTGVVYTGSWTRG